MLWTDGQVELLKTLWLDGVAASKIAAQLGGVTRNAVIGKVHRLSLPGRPARPRALPKRREPKPEQRSLTTFNRAPRVLKAPRAAARVVQKCDEPLNTPVELGAVPMSLDVPFTKLTANMCKWPFGEAEFHFCGHDRYKGSPYCHYHSRVAYQPPSERRRNPYKKFTKV